MSRYTDTEKLHKDIDRAQKVVEDGVVPEEKFQAVLFEFFNDNIDADPLEADA
jgi:hypothetical protein